MDILKKVARRTGGWMLVAATLATFPAAAAETPPGPLEGSFAGTTVDKKDVKLQFYQVDRSFFAEGTSSGERMLVSGALSVCGVGAVEGWRESGELIALSLSADGQILKIERQGEADVLLERQEGTLPPPGESGPMTGDWVAVDKDAILAEVALLERAEMLAGIAMVTGDAVGVTGRVIDRGLARGVVTFADGSQVAYTAELSGDGSTMTVEGFGKAVKLVRRGAP